MEYAPSVALFLAICSNKSTKGFLSKNDLGYISLAMDRLKKKKKNKFAQLAAALPISPRETAAAGRAI